MKFMLIRHAEAVDLGTNGVCIDYDRMLTDRGHKQASCLAVALQRLGFVPGRILSSPLVRAWQTAEHLAHALTPGKAPIGCERLAVGESRFRKLTREAAEPGHELTLLVGHMPHLAEYAVWLLGATEGAIDFKKAGAALIVFNATPDKGGGRLKWLVEPAWYMPQYTALGSTAPEALPATPPP